MKLTGSCGPIAIVAGKRSPAMSVSWEAPTYPDRDSGFVIFFAECDLDIPEEDWPASQLLCMHCLIEDSDAQLARGLELAKVHGQVDWDVAAGEWRPAADRLATV